VLGLVIVIMKLKYCWKCGQHNTKNLWM